MTHRRGPVAIAAMLTILAACGTASAQRADENAVTQAQDAFGTSIGFQSIGIYSENDARGFSPQQAGNLRIEGLYFDRQTWVTNDCMARETTMRVGIAAQSYSFPAPTGIVDIALRAPGDKAVSSAILTRGPFNTATADVETQIPIIGHVLSAGVCAGYRRNFEVEMFRTSHEAVFGTTLRWRPTTSIEVKPFWSYVVGGARGIIPNVYTDGVVQLPLFRTHDLGTQGWTNWGWHQTTFGAIVRAALSDRWQAAGGVFRSVERDPLGYQPYLTLTTPRTADSVMDVAPPFSAASTSGELRLTRSFVNGLHRQRLQFAVRGRSVEREFGGDAIIDFGTLALNSQAPFAQPTGTLTPQSRDTTRQLDFGVAFEEKWQGVGSFEVGVLHPHYRRRVLTPAKVDINGTRPWLLNLRWTAQPRPGLGLYGSYVQGLEDSALAPVSAANRNEPPPATRTWQLDAGFRWVPIERFQLVLGAFDIHKPYFNLDVNNLYTLLGRVEHRGFETSLSFNDSGFTLLVGGVRLSPRVKRDIAEPGATGNIPLGPVPLTLTADMDYAPPRWGPWAASLQWNFLSARVATTNNDNYLPSLATIGAGVRYHSTLLESPWTARLDAFNLADTQGLRVSNLNVVLPEQGRRFMLSIALDF